MLTRKIIQFGKSSYVVSIPKSWVLQNKLTKGSELTLDESASGILLFPKQGEGKEELKIKKIEYNTPDRQIGRKIISAYINNFQIIEVYGQDLKEHIDEIEKVSHSLVALEIMEHTPKKVIIKDFLNVNDISIDNIIKRIDIIIRSMMSDIQDCLSGKEIDKIELESRDVDINRLFHVGQKLINKVLDNPNMSRILNIKFSETLFYWKVLDSLEKIADQQKRVVRNIHELCEGCPSKKRIKDIYDEVVGEYMNVVKAMYKNDKEAADKVLSRKGELLRKCDSLTDIVPKDKCKEKMHVHNLTEISSKIMRFVNYNTQIAKAIINNE